MTNSHNTTTSHLSNRKVIYRVVFSAVLMPSHCKYDMRDCSQRGDISKFVSHSNSLCVMLTDFWFHGDPIKRLS